MSRTKRISIVLLVVIALTVLLPVSALAGSNTRNGITLFFPDTQIACSPDGTIWVTGAGSQTVNYTFLVYDATTNTMIFIGSASATGDTPVEYPYPATIGGTMTFVVSASVGATKLSGQWKVTCTPPPGSEGCTPGYWRNHLEDWPSTGFAPTDFFQSVFGVSIFTPTYTLGQAINQGGGGINRLARHGTAALLSAAHPAVDYPYTVAQVIAMVQAGFADPLAAANELGCSIP